MEIEIIIKDGQGKIINQQTETSYELGSKVNNLTEIEGEVERLKRELLPSIEADLLSHSQTKETEVVKKNGTVQRKKKGDD